MTTQNAVVDQLRDSGNGQRPSVDTENPDLPLVVYLDRGRALLYRSLSKHTRIVPSPRCLFSCDPCRRRALVVVVMVTVVGGCVCCRLGLTRADSAVAVGRRL